MPLAADAVAALTAKGLTLATAEATTGGLIGHLLTEMPASSRVFRGGVAPYANALKQAIGFAACRPRRRKPGSRRSAGQCRSRVGERGHRIRRDWQLRPGRRWPRSPGRSLLDRAGHCRRHSQRAIRLRGRPLGEPSGVRGGGAANAPRGAVRHLKRRAC